MVLLEFGSLIFSVFLLLFCFIIFWEHNNKLKNKINSWKLDWFLLMGVDETKKIKNLEEELGNIKNMNHSKRGKRKAFLNSM